MTNDLKWIEEGLKKPGKTQTGLAAALKRSPSAITALLKGERELKIREIPIVAAYLEVIAPGMDATPSQSTKQSFIPSRQLVGIKDLPIYALTQGGDGAEILSTDPIDYMKRPAPLENVKEGYGIIVESTSMIPAYRPGDVALVNPLLPPRTGEEVVLYSDDGFGERRSIIKHLLRVTRDEWFLEQFNPPDEEERKYSLSRREWTICHRVVGKYSRR